MAHEDAYRYGRRRDPVTRFIARLLAASLAALFRIVFWGAVALANGVLTFIPIVLATGRRRLRKWQASRTVSAERARDPESFARRESAVGARAYWARRLHALTNAERSLARDTSHRQQRRERLLALASLIEASGESRYEERLKTISRARDFVEHELALDDHLATEHARLRKLIEIEDESLALVMETEAAMGLEVSFAENGSPVQRSEALLKTLARERAEFVRTLDAEAEMRDLLR